MPPHTSWLNFVPGYDALSHALHDQGHGWLFGDPVHAQHIAALLLVLLVLTGLALSARGGLNKAKGDILPDSKLTSRNLVELLMEGVLMVMQFAMPRAAAIRHFWIVGTLGFFILFSNLLGLIPGFLPPTESFNTTFACATVVFIYYNFYAFKKLGLGHIEHMANPMGEWNVVAFVLAPLFIIVETISHFIRPVSLSVRLLCNIAGDHLVLGVFIGIFPLVLPIPFMALGLFVALVQTFIFLLLSSVYIGEVEANIEHAQHAHGHGHDHDHGQAEAAAH